VCEWVLLDPVTHQMVLVLTGQVRPQPQALARWLHRLSRYPIAPAAVEATGGWKQPVVQALHQGQIPVLIASPKRVRRLREALG